MYWAGLTTLILTFVSFCDARSDFAFENTAIVRTVELGGSLVHVTTTYAVKALKPNQKSYTVAVAKLDKERTGWFEAKIKGQEQPLEVEEEGIDADTQTHLLKVILPSALPLNGTANIVIDTSQTRATYAWPDTLSQKEEQRLKYDTPLFVTSPYKTAVQRTKIRAPAPRFVSYTEPAAERTSDFVSENNAVSKSGATLTYGPYINIPPSTTGDFTSKHQTTLTIHYFYDFPVIEVIDFKRSAEISHWGANLNIEDKIHLKNGGPTLKGHFSRIDYQSQSYYKRQSANMINGVLLHLPPAIQNTYYYDLIGNVSTSHLRVAPAPSPKSNSRTLQQSVLELRPRYPLMGGWNYSFTLGWDAPLEHSARYDAQKGRYLVQIPVMSHIPGSSVHNAEVKIVLPEGATDVEYVSSFPALSTDMITHTTYLDTIGRPALIFKYKDLTDKHISGLIYVSYKVPLTAHLRKPLAVSGAFLLLFVIAYGVKNVDLRLNKPKQKSL